MIGWRYGILSRYLLAELLLLCILYSVLCVPSVPSYSEYNISNILLYASTHTDSSDTPPNHEKLTDNDYMLMITTAWDFTRQTSIHENPVGKILMVTLRKGGHI